MLTQAIFEEWTQNYYRRLHNPVFIDFWSLFQSINSCNQVEASRFQRIRSLTNDGKSNNFVIRCNCCEKKFKSAAGCPVTDKKQNNSD